VSAVEIEKNEELALGAVETENNEKLALEGMQNRDI
jgi:hypothetical protein